MRFVPGEHKIIKMGTVDKTCGSTCTYILSAILAMLFTIYHHLVIKEIFYNIIFCHNIY